jgi:hypothetical protein
MGSSTSSASSATRESSAGTAASLVVDPSPTITKFVETFNAVSKQTLAVTYVDAIEDIGRDVEGTTIYLMDEHFASVSANSKSVRDQCSYDFFVPKETQNDPKKMLAYIQQLSNLLGRIQSPRPSKEETLLDAGQWSHFVSLTFPTIDAAADLLPALRIGADAWELRVDLLEDMSPASLHYQIGLLREISPLPIVFTVRTTGQIGKFPGEEDPRRIFTLLRYVDTYMC